MLCPTTASHHSTYGLPLLHCLILRTPVVEPMQDSSRTLFSCPLYVAVVVSTLRLVLLPRWSVIVCILDSLCTGTLGSLLRANPCWTDPNTWMKYVACMSIRMSSARRRASSGKVWSISAGGRNSEVIWKVRLSDCAYHCKITEEALEAEANIGFTV